VVKEKYNQPLLTQHEPLHALTGQSSAKTADKDPNIDIK
jgi:hypothetical protein